MATSFLRTLRPNKHKIYVSADTPRTLYRDVHSACVVDLMITGSNPNYLFRDLTTGAMFTKIQDLGLTSLQYSGGSTAAEDQVIDGNSDEDVGQGYNSINCAFSDSVNCPTTAYNKDFHVHSCNLCDDLGIPITQIANVQFGANYDLLTEAYGGSFTVTIDAVVNSLGTIASASALLTALNNLSKGLWVRNGNKFTVSGIRTYGNIVGSATYAPSGNWATMISWKLALANSLGIATQHLAMGLEDLLSAYDAVWENSNEGYGATNYRNKVQPTINTIKTTYPAVKIYADVALVSEGMSKRENNWDERLDVTGMYRGSGMANVDGCRVYFNLSNFTTNFVAGDDAANLAILNNILNVLIPQRISLFKSYYPGKSMGIWQWGVRNPMDANNINNTMLSVIYLTKFYKFMVDWNYNNNNFITYASFQSLKSIWLDNGNTDDEYLALRLNGKMFVGTPDVYQLRISNLSGVSGYCVKSGSTYRIMLINEGSTNHTQTGINIGNTQYTSWLREAYSAASLGTSTVSYTSPVTESGTLNIPAYSINYIQVSTS